MGMRRCTSCGTSWPAGAAKACPFCGGAAADEASPPPSPAPVSSAPVDPEARKRLRRDLPRYVEKMLEGDTLTAARERAIANHIASLGVDPRALALVIDTALQKLSAKRGPADGLDEQAIENAAARLRDVIADVEAEPVPLPVPPPPAPIEFPSPPPPAPIELAPAPAPSEEPAPKKPFVVHAAEESPPEAPVSTPVYFKKAEPAPAPAVPEPPKPEAPPIEMPETKPERAVEAPPPEPAPAELKEPAPPPEPAPADPPPPEPEPVPAPEPPKPIVPPLKRPMERTPAMEKKPMTAMPDRTPPPRRSVRALASLLAVAMAFAAGNLVAAFAPKVATRFDSLTAGLRGRIADAVPAAHLTGVAAGAVALLLIVLIWLAGRPNRRGFLIPSFVLCLAAAAAGLQPLGHRLDLERTAVVLGNEAKALREDVVRWTEKAGAAEERSKQQATRIGELLKQVDGQEKAAAAAAESSAKQLAAKDEQVKALERKTQDQAVTLAERDRKIAAQDAAAASAQKDLAAVRKENELLKKEIEELKKRVPK